MLLVLTVLRARRPSCSRDDDDEGAVEGESGGEEAGTALDDPGFGDIEEECSEGEGRR